MTEEKRTLIETFLPVDEISEEAKKERNGRAPTFEMHNWWTRKPLVAARAAVLGALLPSDYDIKEFKKLLGLGRDERSHNYDIPLDQLEQLKQEYYKVWGKNPIILDPFSGGGSIPFEAMRVGIDVIANDYNPVAHLVEKATLEYPRRYGPKLHRDVELGLKWIFEETKRELEQFYPKHDLGDVVAYIWAWSVICPNCGFDNPLVGQWDLVKKTGNHQFLDPSVVDGKLHLKIKDKGVPQDGNCVGGKGRCINCGTSIDNDTIKQDINKREKEILLAVVISKKRGKEYELPTNEDLLAFDECELRVKHDFNSWVNSDLLSLNEIPKDTRGSLSTRLYLDKWHKLLNSRQKILFITLLKNINKYNLKLIEGEDKEYVQAVATYLVFIFGKHINFNCRSTIWYRSYEKIAPTLTFRGIPMMWDHAEVNPFVKGSGTLPSINNSILKGLDYATEHLRNRGDVKISLNSITQLDFNPDLIITDPPYFDDIRYAEFSEFFYVWEKKGLEKIINLGEIQNKEELSVGGWGRTPEYFNKLFLLSCKKMHDILNDNGLLVMFFAHSSIEAWDFVINSLQKTGFRITATWPVHTESVSNPIAHGKASIMSSIIIVARKRKVEKSGYIEEIQDDVKAHLMKRLDEFWKYGLRGADLTVSAMGATLDIITQYSEIKSFTGQMQIKDVLELVQKYVAQYVLDRYMKNSSGLDAATSFYLYTRLSQLEGMPFDTANLIAKSMNVDLKLFEKQGLIETSKKGKAQGIKILNFSSRETNGKQSLIDCVQFVMTTFAKGGYTEVERELATITFSRNEIKDVLEALTSLPTEDPERQVAQKILERMGQSFPKQGQTGLDNF